MSSTSSCSSSLTGTAKIIAQTIDGASERAVLVADDGTVLHRNGAADHFLFQSEEGTPHMITDFLIVPEGQDWRTLDQVRVIMKKNGGQRTRNARHVNWVRHEEEETVYHVLYICSRHERVREIVDHAFDPVLTINEDGVIRTANDAARQLFGYSDGELVGHNMSKICGGGHAAHHDEYIQKYRETGEKHVIGKKREVTGLKKDGTEFICELGVQEIKDVSTGQRFFCGFIKDLTQLKEHEAEIRERQALAQGMINASFDSMLEIDQDGIIHIVNDAACSMFGYTREELIGSNISLLCGDGHAERHGSYLRRYLETGEKRIIGIKRQVKARRKDGSELEVELGVQEVVLTSGKKAFCGFIRDLTQQKKDKRALRKQQELIHGKFFGGEDAWWRSMRGSQVLAVTLFWPEVKKYKVKCVCVCMLFNSTTTEVSVQPSV